MLQIENRQSFNAFPLASADVFRAKKRPNMEKFPEDVGIAESKTGGDPNIIDEPEFQPEQKPNIAKIFGDQTPKLKKGKTGRRKVTSPEEESPFYARASKPVILFKRVLLRDSG